MVTSTIVQGIVLPFAQAFAFALAPILLGLGLALLRKHNIDTTWFEAVGRAGGEAYKALLASGRPVTDRAALILAGQAGADYLTQRVPGIVASKNLTPEALAQIAGAELGKLLGVDPTVTPGAGKPVALPGVMG